jgi:formylglycine-generating enzyme required for sulfatase activity
MGMGKGRRPVINVSWDDAKDYLDWLSRHTGKTYRLLTEAEWEYAARAGTTTYYAFGDKITGDQAKLSEGAPYSAGTSAEVGSFPANRFRLHDMHGNVEEWVEDCWNGSYHGAPADGSARITGECDRRVLRGGNWVANQARYLRSANRNLQAPGFRSLFIGFRVAGTL